MSTIFIKNFQVNIFKDYYNSSKLWWLKYHKNKKY